MAIKIALIGAGSMSFGPGTIRDVLLSDALTAAGIELALMDIVPGHLPDREKYAHEVAHQLGRSVSISSTTNLDEALRGADLCLDCYCPASGSCDLQRYGIEYEVFKNRFHGGEAHDYPADFRHDFIMREPNRCISCGRCVRVCRMEVGSSCYDNMDRGFDSIVSTARSTGVRCSKATWLPAALSTAMPRNSWLSTTSASA